MASRSDIVSFLDEYLSVGAIDDVSCNGLQVEGAVEVQRVGLAVDASLEAYRRAAESGCGMLLVHHGIIWGGLRSISGNTYRHVRFLIEQEISLYAAHLPLDLHAESGNNARLAAMLGLQDVVPFGVYHGILIGYAGRRPDRPSLSQLSEELSAALGGTCTTLPFGPERCELLGIVSGGGSDALPEAVRKGLHCLVTGEPSHPNHHFALETGINVLYGGHYHTETPGVKALGALLEEKFGIEAVFLDVPTLV